MARLEMTSEAVMAPVGAGGDTFFRLGLMYATGRSVQVDRIAAHKWFNLAAANGNVEARAHRREIAAEMTELEVAEAQRQAREWMAR